MWRTGNIPHTVSSNEDGPGGELRWWFCPFHQYPLPTLADPNSSHCVGGILKVTAFTGNDQTFKLLVNACGETRILQVRDKSQNLWLWMVRMGAVKVPRGRKRRFHFAALNYIVIWCRLWCMYVFFLGGIGITNFENIPMNVSTMTGKIPGNQSLIFSAFAPSLLPFEERAASFCPHRPAVTVVKDRDAGVGSNPMRPVWPKGWNWKELLGSSGGEIYIPGWSFKIWRKRSVEVCWCLCWSRFSQS